MEAVSLLVLILGGIIIFFIFLYFVPVNLWITALFSGVKVGLFDLVFMRIRKVPPRIVVDSLITQDYKSLRMIWKPITWQAETYRMSSGRLYLLTKQTLV